MLLTWTSWLSLSLSLSCHSPLSSIAPGRSSRLHAMFIQNCWRLVLVGRSTLACPCEEVDKKPPLTSSSLFLQQCPVCFVRLIQMVSEMGDKLPYCCCFVCCCFQDLFYIDRSILAQPPCSFFIFICMWCIHKRVLIQPRLGRNSVLFYRTV